MEKNNPDQQKDLEQKIHSILGVIDKTATVKEEKKEKKEEKPKYPDPPYNFEITIPGSETEQEHKKTIYIYDPDKINCGRVLNAVNFFSLAEEMHEKLPQSPTDIITATVRSLEHKAFACLLIEPNTDISATFDPHAKDAPNPMSRIVGKANVDLLKAVRNHFFVWQELQQEDSRKALKNIMPLLKELPVDLLPYILKWIDNMPSSATKTPAENTMTATETE